jgi:hypothetical protein
MNAVCERFIGTVRRECLDHVIILDESQLRTVLDEYVAYLNRSRPHQGLEQRVPLSSTTRDGPTAPKIVAHSVLAGLHHDYGPHELRMNEVAMTTHSGIAPSPGIRSPLDLRLDPFRTGRSWTEDGED